jgi:hypothetical protein
MTYDTDNGFREISVVLFDGTIATLWWPTSIPIPASYTVELVNDAHGRFTRCHDLKLTLLQ